MAKPTLVPFRAEHFLDIVCRDPYDEDVITDAWRREADGPAFTAMVEDKAIACAGVMIVRPGVGFAWTVFSNEFVNYKIWVTRTIRLALRDIIRSCQLHRVEAHVLENDARYHKWIELFGFEPEGVAHDYTTDRRNIVRYEWVRYKLRIVPVGALDSDTRQFEARLGDEVVGYAAHRYTPEDHYAYGIQCVVDPANRGRGIGLALHKARLEQARKDGSEFFVGMSDNPAMIRVLMKCGARRCPTQHGVTFVVKL